MEKKRLIEILRKFENDSEVFEYLVDVILDDICCDEFSFEICQNSMEPYLIDAGFCEENEVELICRNIFKDISNEISKKQKVYEEISGIKLNENNKQPTFYDPYLGISSNKAVANWNRDIPISQAVKEQKKLQLERDKIMRMRNWSKASSPLPPPQRRHGEEQLSKLTDIHIDGVTVTIGGRDLLTSTKLSIVIGRKYGLIGKNGIGKSTLFSALIRRDISGISNNISIGCIEQEIAGTDKTALECVLDVDIERTMLMAEEKKILESGDISDKRLKYIYERLEAIDAANSETEACVLLAGLGLSVEMQNTETKKLSGGWRMRVALARGLFANPDILCLDEPTNHLDLHANLWLENYLINLNKTIIVVSHSRNFLNAVCTDIILFKDKQLSYYRGNYDKYEKVRFDREKQLEKQHETQKKEVEHVESFINRFRANAKKASMVQSRIKFLERMPMLDLIVKDETLVFNFPKPEPLAGSILSLSNIYFDYIENHKVKVIVRDFNLHVDLDTRIALCGVNGSGKSTILKILTGKLEPKDGVCFRHPKLKIGYFSQHIVDELDITLNAVENLQLRYGNINEEIIRNYLGKFGVCGTLALEPLYVLSGGQKCRVAIAYISYAKPHILVLDEPTNHLDIEAVETLIAALNEFEGGVVIVSHDDHLLECCVDKIYHMDPNNKLCYEYKDEFKTYKSDLIAGRI